MSRYSTMSRWSCLVNVCLCLVLVILCSCTADARECVVIFQGLEKGTETFARNTADALKPAMAAIPGGAKVTYIRPNGATGNGGVTYKDKAEAIAKLKAAVCDAECDNVVIQIIGHGYPFRDETQKPPKVHVGVQIGLNETIPSSGLYGDDIAKIIDECKKTVKIFDDTCFGSSVVSEIQNALTNKNLTQIAIASSGSNQIAAFWPQNNTGHYYLFSRYFLEDYYLLLTNPNVMADIAKEAARLKLHIIVVLMHEAFISGKAKTVQRSGGTRVPSEPVAPAVQQSSIMVPSTPIIKIDACKTNVTLDGNELHKYRFHFYKVVDSTDENAKKKKPCKVVGFVADKLWKPIAPIQSVECKIDCSVTKFKFIEGTTTHEVEISKKGRRHLLTIDGNEKPKSEWTYSSTLIPFMSGGNNLGTIQITTRLGRDPIVDVFYPKKPKKDGHARAKKKKLKWDSKTNTFTGEYTFCGKTFKLTITFKPFGEISITISEGKQSGGKPYSHYLVMRHSLYEGNGERRGEATMISDKGPLEGELWLEARDLTFPLNGFRDEQSGQFHAFSETDEGIYELSYKEEPSTGQQLVEWQLLGNSGGPLIARSSDPPLMLDVSGIFNGNEVLLTWNVSSELSGESAALMEGFRIAIYDEFGNLQFVEYVPPKVNEFVVTIPATAEALQVYRYYVSSVLANKLACECCDGSENALFPHLEFPSGTSNIPEPPE